MNGCTNDLYFMSVYPLNDRSDLSDGVQQQIDITDIRKIADDHRFTCQDRCGDQCKCGILRTADIYDASQRFSAFDEILFHILPRE